MNHSYSALFSVARLLAVGGVIFTSLTHAQSTPPPPAPFSGVVNTWLRKSDPDMAAWDIGGSFRMRYEMKANGGAVFGVPGAASGADFRDHLSTTARADNDNDYFLTKLRARVGYTAEWFQFLAEGRTSTSISDDRKPRTESDDPVDLHQAYVLIGHHHKEFPLSLKIGRQELSYGEERLVGAFAWNNVGRVFDAAKVRWQNQDFSVDFFTGFVNIPRDNQFNKPNHHDWFSGVYASSKLIPRQTTELYFLSRNTSDKSPTFAGAGTPAAFNGPPKRDIYTIGLRMKSHPKAFGPWDYSMELMGQFGQFFDPAPTVSRDLDHLAFAAVWQGGYTWTECSMSPRLGLEYAYASGDNDATDGNHETFENLFPTNHKFYGYMDFVSLQNIHDIRLSYTMKPTTRLSTAVEYHTFWLANTSDNFYNVGGVRRGGVVTTPGTGYGINPSYNHYLGSEIDFVIGCTLTKYAALEAGYGHFFAGKYINQSLQAPSHGSTDADYVYLQATLNF